MIDELEKADAVRDDATDKKGSTLHILSYVVSDEKKETYTVSFDNGEILDFTAEEFFENSLYDTDVPLGISFDDLILKIYSKRAFYEGVRFVLFSKKTVSQVRDHLHGLGFDETCTEFAVTALLEEGHLDDISYAKKFIRKAVDSRIVSCMMIVCELRQKGISEDITRQCLDEMDIDDYTLASKAYMKKKALGVNDVVKIRRFLAGKGFSGDAIHRAVNMDYME